MMNKESDTSTTRPVLSSLQGSPEETEGIEWQLLVGGNYGDSLTDIQLTGDGGYIAAGATASTNGDVPVPSLGSSDAWVVKINSTGTIEWQKRFGGSNYDQAMSIRRTLDGGYVFAGRSASAGTHGSDDVWVVKLDSNGNQQWQSFMGGSYSDYGRSIRQTADGGYIVAGNTFSKDIETAGNDVGGIYAARLDSSGTVLWQRAIGGSGSDFGSSIIPSDGGYILAGYSDSTDFGSDQRKGAEDIVIIKLDESGDEDWLKVIGGIGYDRTGYDNVISPAPGGGYILTAQSTSGDIADIHGSFDALVVKLNPDGTIYEEDHKKWLKMYGGSYCEVTGSITPLTDGGYMLTSQAASSQSGDIPEKNFGEHDIWVVRLDANGNIVWQKLMGGNRWDQTTSIRETNDGGYIFAGFTQSSNSGYIGTNHGYEDAWIVKLNPGLAVDVMDADTNEPVYGATVYLYDVTHNEERNVTAINGHTSFSKSGETLQYRLVVGNKYSVRATADDYFDSNPVAVTYSGDGQRVMVNITATERPIPKTFSITRASVGNDGCDFNKPSGCTNEQIEYHNLEIALQNADPNWKKNFLNQGFEVTKETFQVQDDEWDVTDSTLHYHTGHGRYNPAYPEKNGIILVNNPTLEEVYLTPSDVERQWGGKNKWIILSSCQVLRDPEWGRALSTTHGILGFTTNEDLSRMRNLPAAFIHYSMDMDQTVSGAWKNATKQTFHGAIVKDYDGNKITVRAGARFANASQYYNDHLPGHGSIEPDVINPEIKDQEFNDWECKEG